MMMMRSWCTTVHYYYCWWGKSNWNDHSVSFNMRHNYWCYVVIVLYTFLYMWIKSIHMATWSFCIFLLTLSTYSGLNVSVLVCHWSPDLQYLADIRQQIPITAQRRDDLYNVTSVQEGSSWALWRDEILLICFFESSLRNNHSICG